MLGLLSSDTEDFRGRVAYMAQRVDELGLRGTLEAEVQVEAAAAVDAKEAKMSTTPKLTLRARPSPTRARSQPTAQPSASVGSSRRSERAARRGARLRTRPHPALARHPQKRSLDPELGASSKNRMEIDAVEPS